MQNFMSITITRYGNCPEMDHGHVYINVGKLDTAMRVDVETARKQLARLAKILGEAPNMNINQFNPSISYVQLSGFID